MSNIVLSEKAREGLTDREVAAIGASFVEAGTVATGDSKARQEILREAKAAAKAAQENEGTSGALAAAMAVIRQHATEMYGNPDAVAQVTNVARATAAYGQAAIDFMHESAYKSMRLALDIDPKVRAGVVGSALENIDPDSVKSPAFRKRWTRYLAIAKAVKASEAAVKSGTPDAVTLTPKAVMAALTSTPATVGEVLALAEQGKPMPKPAGAVAADTSKDDTPKVYPWSQVIGAAENLSDRLKHRTTDAPTDAQVATLAGILTNIVKMLDKSGVSAK